MSVFRQLKCEGVVILFLIRSAELDAVHLIDHISNRIVGYCQNVAVAVCPYAIQWTLLPLGVVVWFAATDDGKHCDHQERKNLDFLHLLEIRVNKCIFLKGK